MSTVSSLSRLRVPYVDLAIHDEVLKEKLLEATDRVLSSGQFILGEEVQQFEEEFASYSGSKYAVGVGSGTDALVLTLLSLGIGPGDEVIIPPITCKVVPLTLLSLGVTPVYADISAETLNLEDRKSTRLNSSHSQQSRMPSSA